MYAQHMHTNTLIFSLEKSFQVPRTAYNDVQKYKEVLLHGS